MVSSSLARGLLPPLDQLDHRLAHRLPHQVVAGARSPVVVPLVGRVGELLLVLLEPVPVEEHARVHAGRVILRLRLVLLCGGPEGSAGSLSCTSGLDTAILPRHRWYYFKEAFSPKIVTRAIEDTVCIKNDLIIDPFCGSGTVPLVSAFEGLRTKGIEVNPFLGFVSRTKLLHCKAKTFIKKVPIIFNGIEKGENRSRIEGYI